MVTDLAIANELLEQKQIYIEEQQNHIEELTRKLHSTQQQLKALQHHPACRRQGGTIAQTSVWPQL